MEEIKIQNFKDIAAYKNKLKDKKWLSSVSFDILKMQMPTLRIVGSDFYSSLNYNLMQAFCILQDEIYRSFAEYKYGKRNKSFLSEDEKIALGIINRSYRKAFENDISSRKELRFAIDYLFQINRDEISRLKKEASQISMAGAWGLVFMSLFMFFITLWFLRKLDKKLLVPTNEIYDVIKCYKNNEKFRRCKGTNLNRDIKFIFNGVNDLLDERIKYDKQ